MKILPQWWRSNFLVVELAVVAMVAAAFVGWAECLGGVTKIDLILVENRGSLYGTLASIFGSLLGFTITAASIVLGFSSSPRLRIIRESEHYSMLWKVFGATIRALGFATVLSLVGLVFDRDANPSHWVLYLVGFAFLLACMRIARAVWVLDNIIGLIARPPG